MMKYVFKKPYEFEGKTYEELEYDLDTLKGSDIAEVKKQYMKDGNFTVLPATDNDFCARVLARACKLPLEFFTQMSAKDYLQITQEVSNFLLG